MDGCRVEKSPEEQARQRAERAAARSHELRHRAARLEHGEPVTPEDATEAEGAAIRAEGHASAARTRTKADRAGDGAARN